VGAQTIEKLDGGVVVRGPDVDVERERRLAACELAHRLVHELIPGAARYQRVGPDREWVGASARHTQPVAEEVTGEVARRRAASRAAPNTLPWGSVASSIAAS